MANKVPRRPIALTIAGSDSGGGAGIQADLKTFASLGVHGTTAITCLTAQNPVEVTAIEPCSPDTLRAQILAVFRELTPAAVKTGMLYSARLAKVVAEHFEAESCPPLVVDPVLVATSGATLGQRTLRNVLLNQVLPRATLVTPNLDEVAALLAGKPPESVEQMRSAARNIHQRCGCAVLIKGGHLRRAREAVDIFYNGATELLLQAPLIKGLRTHGTGCTFSAAITAYLAHGYDLCRSVTLAKDYISRAIAESYRAGQHLALNSFWA